MGFEKFFSDEGSALPLGLALMRMGGRSDRPRNLGVELGTAFEQQAKMQQAKQQQMLQQLQMERIKAAILKEKKMEGLSEQLAALPPQFMKPAVPGAVDQGMLGPNLPIQSQQGQQLAEQMGSGGSMADLLALNQSANFAQQGTPQEMPLQGQPASMDYKGLMQAQLPILEKMKPGSSFEYAAQQQKSEEDREFKAAELKQKYQDRVAEIKLRAEEGRITREEADKRMIEARREMAQLAASLRQPSQPMAPVVYIDPATGKAIWGNINDARGKPAANYTPGLQGDISAAKAEGKELGEKRGNIGGSIDALSSVGRAKQILEEGIYSGAWGPLQKEVIKRTPGMDKAKAARTEEFISEIGNTIVPRLKEFGGNDSNEELRYLKAISGGEITMEPAALKKVIESSEAKIKRGIERAKKGQSPDGKKAAPKFLGFE